MQLRHARLAAFTAATSLTLCAAWPAAAIVAEPPGNYDAYFTDLAETAAQAARATDPARIGSELTQGQLNQRDPLMNKATFVWAGANALIAQVGPLTRDAQIDAQARDFLRQQAPALGLDAAALDQAVAFDIQDLGHGPVIARYEQYIGGIQVFNRNLNVVMDRAGRPVAASGYFAGHIDVTQVLTKSFALGAAGAVHAAFALRGGAADGYAFAAADSRDGYQWFTASPLTRVGPVITRMPRAKPVYFEQGGTLVPAYYVEMGTDDRAGGADSLFAFVISADRGEMLFRNNLIAYESTSYRVFAEVRVCCA